MLTRIFQLLFCSFILEFSAFSQISEKENKCLFQRFIERFYRESIEKQKEPTADLEEVQEIMPFIVITPPKCGTNLLGITLHLISKRQAIGSPHLAATDLKSLELIQNISQNNSFLITHPSPSLTYSLLTMLSELNYKIISILRDPRDQLISLYDYIEEGSHSHPIVMLNTVDEKIEELITGNIYLCPSHSYLQPMINILNYLKEENVYIVHFENLVGEKGGGSAELQKMEIKNLANFLNISLLEEEIEEISHQIFGNSKTFRKGQIGRWKDIFNPAQKKLYKDLYGQQLIELGYEKDFDW